MSELNLSIEVDVTICAWPAEGSADGLVLMTADNRSAGYLKENAMKSLLNLVKKFVADEHGLETVEYAIIGGLIVAGSIATIAAIGAWVNIKFGRLQTNLGTP